MIPEAATDFQADEHWHLERPFAEREDPSANGKKLRLGDVIGWDDLKRKGYNSSDVRVIMKMENHWGLTSTTMSKPRKPFWTLKIEVGPPHHHQGRLKEVPRICCK